MEVDMIKLLIDDVRRIQAYETFSNRERDLYRSSKSYERSWNPRGLLTCLDMIDAGEDPVFRVVDNPDQLL
jgi:hypothetical protein